MGIFWEMFELFDCMEVRILQSISSSSICFTPAAAYGYPGMPPYYCGGGSQWGSNQSMDAMGMPPMPLNPAPVARSQANLSNMDANRAIW